MSADLGTYHLRVNFDDGSGYFQRIDTGRRYTDGKGSCHPLTAQVIEPLWDNETEMIDSLLYLYLKGHYSCDCNRAAFLAAAHGKTDPDVPCGETLRLNCLTLIRPDGTECVIYPKAGRSARAALETP